MKNYFLPILAVATIGMTGNFTNANEEKPKVFLCQSTECETAESPVKQTLQETRSKVAELSHNDPTVMKNFDALAEILNISYQKEKSMTVREIQEVCTGIHFAAEKHRLQTRKNKERTPYVSHPIGVAYNLMHIGDVRDTAVIIGALLHDTVEDTQTTFEEVENKFGKLVASLVREVTDDKSLAKEARKRLQVINAAHKSKGAAQIKLADKLYNLNDLFSSPPADWTQMRIDHYYEWAQSVIDRLPNNANDKLHKAVEGIINQYWEKQVPSSAS
jgi:guanosine-3',5'-bis(diphosphate) 3'-pyrophosphohydrolase